MRRLILMALLLVVGQATAGEQLIDVQHDSVRGVTCWIIAGTGISCLPDSALQPRPTATPSSESGRASQASSTVENVPLTATPRPQQKGFQL